jgi:hypothetical protein
MLRFAREGIPPSEFRRLTLVEIQRLRGLLVGESTARKHDRGEF